MSELFRESSPAGRYSRKLFFVLALGTLFFSGFDAAVETFNQNTDSTLERVDIVQPQDSQKSARSSNTQQLADSRRQRQYEIRAESDQKPGTRGNEPAG